MNIQVRKRMISNLSFYRMTGCSFIDYRADIGDKIIFLCSGKVKSGELVHIGDKYIHIKVAPDRNCGDKIYFSNERYLIRDIKRIAVFPTGYQKLGQIKCKTNHK